MSHTKGPWTNDKESTKAIETIRANGKWVADVVQGNGDIVSASPDLLELAKHIMAMKNDSYLDAHPEWAEICQEAEKCFSKAEGKVVK